ncbi:hypothetical protein [Paractinoplanes toevensis]|uniref:hypothetical protein n=1 Tax=Paractinoplanes toevensis TaxID=571911 RepID=UPI001BB3D877|nr:hypothetical protein [Actinoplanes toevensis]
MESVLGWLAEAPGEGLALTVAARPVTPAPRGPSRLDKEAGAEPRVAGMRVPATAATTAEWAALWVPMCSEGDSVLGPLNDDVARARYALTAKQLRNVRNAATSGVLRQKAAMLGVELPEEYVDNPMDGRVDGKVGRRDGVGGHI